MSKNLKYNVCKIIKFKFFHLNRNEPDLFLLQNKHIGASLLKINKSLTCFKYQVQVALGTKNLQDTFKKRFKKVLKST